MPQRRFPHRTHFTDAEFLELCERYDWRCLCCGQRGQPLEPNLVIPRERGGLNNIYNIQPMCYVCNLSEKKRAIDHRVHWLQTRQKEPQPLAYDDFDYGLITDRDQRLILYQRTNSIKRLLRAIARDWESFHDKIAEVNALGLSEQVFDAWHRYEVLSAILEMQKRSKM